MSTRIDRIRSIAADYKRRGNSATEAARGILHEAPTTAARAATEAASGDPVTPAEMADALAKAPFPAVETAPALKSIFAHLTALEMGRLLQGAYTSPPITAAEMTAALMAASYPEAEVRAAVATLHPSPATYRREGPFGSPDGTAFDDTELAKRLGQPMTKVIIRSGEIIDSVQSFFGETPTDQHGGNGGGAHTIQLDEGDVLTEVSGYSGTWYGRTYIVQLSLKTRSGKVHDGFGSLNYSTENTPFHMGTSTGQIVGFHGCHILGTQADGSSSLFVNALGVVIKE